jgi:hypothetical protein
VREPGWQGHLLVEADGSALRHTFVPVADQP